MESPKGEQALALAGLLQALDQVRTIATHGSGDPRRMEPCVRALLGRLDAGVAELYGSREALRPGIELVVDHLSQPRDSRLTRYLVTILHLEGRLGRDHKRFQAVVSGLRDAAEQAEYFGSVTHDNVLHNLGDLYQQHVSTMRPRVLVQGERHHLEDPRNAATIRALLLSALRAASLWRHAGGTRLRLIIGRQTLLDNAQAQLRGA